MAEEGEKTRKTHIWRAKNEENGDIWLDIERVDEVVNNEKRLKVVDDIYYGHSYQEVTRTMFWADELLENEEEEPHPTRKTTRLKVKNPEDDDEDTETFVYVRVIDDQKTSRGRGQERLDITKRFRNKNVDEGDEERNETREFEVRRVFHWDTEEDPNEVGGHVYDPEDPEGGSKYVRIDGTEDRSQYVDVALIKRIIRVSGRGQTYQKETFNFNIDPLKEFSEPTPADEIDPDKTVWLDPWQNIINVKWDQPPGPYIVTNFSIFRRLFGHVAQGSVLVPPDLSADPDTIISSLLQYWPTQLWPVTPYPGGTLQLATWEEDDSILLGIDGAPILPGVSAFGAGEVCDRGAGSYGSNLNEYGPGLRTDISGSVSGLYPDMPAPFDDIGGTPTGTEPEWGSPSINLELYTVLSPYGGGSALDTLPLDYSACTIDNGKYNYACIGAAQYPKEEGYVARNPIFTGPAVGLNVSLGYVYIQLIFQITNPPPGYDP